MIDEKALGKAVIAYASKFSVDREALKKGIKTYLEAAAPSPELARVKELEQTIEKLIEVAHICLNASIKHGNAADEAEARVSELEAAAPLPDVAADRLGKWMSAALEDETVCAEMKADINAWFLAGQPVLAAAPKLTLCEDCPPVGYPTDKTRCEPCPRAAAPYGGQND